MKTDIKIQFLLPALIAALNLLPARPAAAQTFTLLHNFTTESDGAHPDGLTLSGNILYGTASAGGISGQGAVFAIIPGEMTFTNLYSFSASAGFAYVNSDGAGPIGGLILSGGTLYGTAFGGGTNG